MRQRSGRQKLPPRLPAPMFSGPRPFTGSEPPTDTWTQMTHRGVQQLPPPPNHGAAVSSSSEPPCIACETMPVAMRRRRGRSREAWGPGEHPACQSPSRKGLHMQCESVHQTFSSLFLPPPKHTQGSSVTPASAPTPVSVHCPSICPSIR